MKSREPVQLEKQNFPGDILFRRSSYASVFESSLLGCDEEDTSSVAVVTEENGISLILINADLQRVTSGAYAKSVVTISLTSSALLM